MTLHEYYERKKSEAVEILSAAIGEPVENTREHVHKALATALKEGTCKTAATAIMAASKWCWAHNEQDEESYKAEHMAGDAKPAAK